MSEQTSSYSPQTQEEIDVLDKQQVKLYDDIRTCEKVKETIETEGWNKIILPSLNRMIVEELGGRLGNNWTYGRIQKETDSNNIWVSIGRKQALLEFHNHVYNYVKMIKTLHSQVAGIDEELKGEFTIPMMDIDMTKVE